MYKKSLTYVVILGASLLASLATPTAVASEQVRNETEFRDSGFTDRAGNPIPSNLANLPFKLIEGFPEYVVGPGDILEITTFETGERTTEVARILPDGTVSFSILNNIPVAGEGISEVVHTISSALGQYVRNPQVQVLMKEYSSKTASVFGSINISTAGITTSRTGPGVYPLKGRMTVLELILEAGGPAPDARFDQVRLIRANRTYILDLQKSIEAGDNTNNVLVEHGDVLQLPGVTQADRRVAVFGEVTSPGIHNLSSNANMLEVISASRGFTEDASANRIRVIRSVDPHNPQMFTVNAEQILGGDLSQNIGLEDGDIVVVPRDVLTDIGYLITQLRPLISFGGFATVEPVLRVGGYDVNSPTTGETAVSPGEVLLVQPRTGEQQVVQQVQQNVRGTAPTDNK